MSNKLVKEDQVLVLTDAIIKKINELGLKISENDSSFRGFIKPNSAAPILRGLYICEDSGIYVYFGQINVTADEINSGIVFIHYTGTAFNKVALPLTNFIKKTDLGKPNSAASLGADGLLSKEQRWEVAVDFNQENTPIWLNTPPPTKAGVFYPSEAGMYVNYGSITISAADLNSNIVRIQFDGVNRFQKMAVGLNGQFLPLSGGKMNGTVVFTPLNMPFTVKELIQATWGVSGENKEVLSIGWTQEDQDFTILGVPSAGGDIKKRMILTKSGWMRWDGALSLNTPDGGTFLKLSNFVTGMVGYIQGSEGVGDDVMTLRKIDKAKYTLKMHDLIAENTVQTPDGDSDQWNSQTLKSFSKFNLRIAPEEKAEAYLIELIDITYTGVSRKVKLSLIDTYSNNNRVGCIEVEFVFLTSSGAVYASSRTTNIIGNTFYDHFVSPNLIVSNGKVCVLVEKRTIKTNPIGINIFWESETGIDSDAINRPSVIKIDREITDQLNQIDFPFSPRVTNPTLPQDAIPMKWANDRFALKSNLSILDGKLGVIDRDLIAVQVVTDLNTVSLNTVSDTVTRQGQSIMQTNSDIGEVRKDYFSKISSDQQNITSPVVFDKLAVFKTVEVPYSRSLNAPVNNSVLADVIAEIPSGGIEIIYETQEIQITEQIEIDLTYKNIKRIPTASFIYENESGLICMGDLNLATKLNLFTYELLMSDRPKFKMNAVSKPLNDFKLYR